MYNRVGIPFAIGVVKRAFHRHHYDLIVGTMEPCGITLGWDFRPTTEYSMLERCQCGAERRSTGWVLPRKVEAAYAPKT